MSDDILPNRDPSIEDMAERLWRETVERVIKNSEYELTPQRTYWMAGNMLAKKIVIFRYINGLDK